MMLSLCYYGGPGRKATVSLVFNLGTDSGRETYLLVNNSPKHDLFLAKSDEKY